MSCLATLSGEVRGATCAAFDSPATANTRRTMPTLVHAYIGTFIREGDCLLKSIRWILPSVGIVAARARP